MSLVIRKGLKKAKDRAEEEEEEREEDNFLILVPGTIAEVTKPSIFHFN